MSSLGESIQKLREKLASATSKGGGGGEGGGGSKFDAKKALAWAKRNPVIVASVAVMVLAPVAAWWFSSEMHAAADAQNNKRAEELAALEKLEKTQVEISLPGLAPKSETGVVNTKAVVAFEELTHRLREDAIAVQKAARQHNQRDRTKLCIDVQVRPDNISVVAQNAFDKLHSGMEQLLTEVRAGSPPDDDRVLDQVQRRQDQFIAGEKKTDRKSLSAEETDKLLKALSDKRLQVYADAAASISFYASINSLGLPATPDAGNPPQEGRLFFWQWRAWMAEDVIRSLAAANKPFRSVVEAPVKRLVSIAFYDGEESLAPPKTAAAGDPNAAPPADPGAAPDPNAAAAVGPPPIDPKVPAPYDFGSTFTGRQTNPLYDVRRFQVTLIVATRGLPEVLNAIARENFMTVLNCSLVPADPFADAAEGYIYGAEPVSQVRLTIESVWMREWLGKLMPKELQAARNTNGKTTDDAAAPAGDAPASSAPAAAPASNG